MSSWGLSVRGRRVFPTFALALGLVAILVAGQAKPSPAKPAPRPAPTARTISFNRDVRPILSEHCYKCHGPAAREAKGNLRLNVESSAKAKRAGLSVIESGNPQRSLVLARVHESAGELRMPPASSGGRGLTPQEQDVLRRWIAEGAHYEGHWAYQSPKKPPVPKVQRTNWVKTPVDAFILSRLERGGIAPELEANRPTLIRRVALTLTGLQPTPEAIQTFLADQAPNAYERMVDRYLASPTYGEHQARYWLDAVRYGDTHGLHLDNERTIYPYRDFVVRALNDDMPFDQFTQWQLAGDMMPNPSLDQRLATGYIRMNPTTNEGGAIEAEFLAKNTFDRVETFGTIFLGLTITCARCHDHKYDAISAEDYYGLYAFFNSTTDKPLDGNELAPAPVIRVPNPAQAKQISTWEVEMGSIMTKVEAKDAKDWLASAKLEPVDAKEWQISPSFGAENFDKAFDTAFDPEDSAKLAAVAWSASDVKIGKDLSPVSFYENSATYLRAKFTVRSSREVELTVGSDDGIKIWANGKLIHSNKVLRSLSMGSDKVPLHLTTGENELLFKIVNSGGGDGFRIEIGSKSEQKLAELQSRMKSGQKISDAEAREAYLLLGPSTPGSERYRAILAERAVLDTQLPQSLVAEELPNPRPAKVLNRGEYDQPGKAVERAVPTAIGRWSKAMPKNRLGLAQWVTQPDHPLTARVFVNRIWQQHFGTGLVKTVEDFGNQGEWPSHPELLDFLATDFVEKGWSLKQLHRTMLLSSTFRQRSNVTSQKLKRDPENRLLSRGPRFRLDAEVLRDQTLYAAGLLQEESHGKGFKPYQPPGLWEAIGFLDSTTSRYVQDKGDSIYRRSLYMFWKRTSPPPTMLIFDAPMRESCTVRRSRTNTPLQALVLMNETGFVEASRFLAQRVILESADTPSRMDSLFLLTLGRLPTDVERSRLTASLNRNLKSFEANPKAAADLLAVGDKPGKQTISAPLLAAWTLIANTLINTDEFVTQH